MPYEPQEEYFMTLVRIKDGVEHGCIRRPGGPRLGGEIYVASADEVMSFGDKFVLMGHDQAIRMVEGMTIERVVELAENDADKAQFLADLERSGKKRSTLIAKLAIIEPKEEESAKTD